MASISDIQITPHMIFLIDPARYDAIMVDINEKMKRKLKPNDKVQIGQVMSFLFPYQTARILRLVGRSEEADLIDRWFCQNDMDCCGFMGVIPGSWDIDRVTKHICKTMTTDFLWVDIQAHRDGMKNFYDVDLRETDDELMALYSQPLSNQFVDLEPKLRKLFKEQPLEQSDILV